MWFISLQLVIFASWWLLSSSMEQMVVFVAERLKILINSAVYMQSIKLSCIHHVRGVHWLIRS